MFLLIADAHSKWVEIHITSTATSSATIELLQRSFAGLGLPEVLVSNNATAFTSSEFSRVSQEEWNPSCPNTAIPPGFKWPGGTGSPDVQGGNEANQRRLLEHTTVSIPIQVQIDTTQLDRCLPCGTNVWEKVEVTVGLTQTGLRKESSSSSRLSE